MAKRYVYDVKVTHTVVFTDSDLEDAGYGARPFTDEDREKFAEENWGSDYDTDFSTDSVTLFDVEEDEFADEDDEEED